MAVVIAAWAALYCWNFYIYVARGRLHYSLHDRSTLGLALWVLGFGNAGAGVAMLFTIIALVAAMMSHLKEQLRDWRAVLTPGFLRPHLVVAGLLFAIACGVGSLMLYASTSNDPWPYLPGTKHDAGVSLLGAVAVTLALITRAAWWSSFRAAWPSIAIVPLCLLLMTHESAMNTLKAILLVDVGAFETALRSGLLLADLGGLYLIARNLCRLGELHEPVKASGLHRRETWAGNEPQREHVACVGFWSRAIHRRVAVLGRGSPWIMAAALGGMLFGISLLYADNHGSHFGQRPSDLNASLLLAAIVPAVSVAIIWRERWATFGYESLFPASRGEFAIELATAMALDLFEFWAAATVAALVPTLIWSPQLLLDPLILASLLATAIIQLLNFGAILFAAQSPGLMGFIITLSALLLASAIPMSLAFHHEPPAINANQLLVAATIEAAGGLLIGLAAIRGWRSRELA